MLISRTSILKGVGGAAAALVVTTGGIIFKVLFEGRGEFSREEREILGNINLPEGCKSLKKPCTLNAEELKKINFLNKNPGEELKIEKDNGKVEMKIERVSGKEKEAYGEKGLKFNLKATVTDLEIKSGNQDNNKFSLIKNTNYEFKRNAGGKLERVWKNAEEAIKKIGFNKCNAANGVPKNCPLLNGKINILNGNEKIKGAEAKTEDKSKNIAFEEGVEGYNNGFKISTPAEIGLVLNSQEVAKLEKDSSSTYEIKFIDDDWYLVKKIQA